MYKHIFIIHIKSEKRLVLWRLWPNDFFQNNWCNRNIFGCI